MTNLALSARAMTPAARGAAAEVPPCCSVHPEFRSVVAWDTGVSGESGDIGELGMQGSQGMQGHLKLFDRACSK